MKRFLFFFGLFFVPLFPGRSEAAPEIDQEIVEFLKPKLNSERIEYFFGSYGVDPLDIDCSVFPYARIANLHSIHHGRKIMRTLAVVDFLVPVHPELCDVHSEIMKGKSIGTALREYGWMIYKNPVYFGGIFLSPGLMDWMEEHDIDNAAIHVYQLDVSKNNRSDLIPYCRIIEIHSPQYLTKEWLQALYEDQYVEYSFISAEVAALLPQLSTLIQEFPFSENEKD